MLLKENSMDIKKIVLETVAEIGEDQDNEVLSKPELLTPLLGINLDSMGIVFLVAELEEAISNELGINLTLADERAMSQKTSPFRSVKTLINYIDMLIKEQQENA